MLYHVLLSASTYLKGGYYAFKFLKIRLSFLLKPPRLKRLG
nr:MAG TPA: hypothetical protein [Caudoviricetes sp.]